MINSIQKTKYKDFSHAIVDVGNINLEKNIFDLKNNLNLFEIRKPKFNSSNGAQKIIPTYAANHCYPYLNKIFPEFRYLIHVETDVLILNDCVFDQLVDLCKKQGIAFACKFNRGIFCIDTQSDYFDRWQKKYEAEQSNQYWHQGKMIEEIYLEDNLPDLNDLDPINLHNQLIFHKGLPVLSNDILCDPTTLKPISSIHIHGECFARPYLTGIPVFNLSEEMSAAQLEKHMLYSKEFLKGDNRNILDGYYMYNFETLSCNIVISSRSSAG